VELQFANEFRTVRDALLDEGGIQSAADEIPGNPGPARPQCRVAKVDLAVLLVIGVA